MTKLNLSLFLEIEVRDKEGNIVYEKLEESRCLLKNFAVSLYTGFIVSTLTMNDTSGVLRNFGNFTGRNPFYALAAAGNADDTYGIQLGTSDTGVTRDDFRLAGKISNGIIIGTLSYGVVTVEPTAQYLTYTQMRVVRVFSNNSALPITIKEVGFVISHSLSLYKFLFARDVLLTPLILDTGYTATFRYLFRVTA